MKLTCTLILLLLCSVTMAETVSGFVVNQNNEPIIGARIMESGYYNGTTTNIDGSFILDLNSSDSKLVFSFIGYETDSLVLKEGKMAQVVLKETPPSEAGYSYLSDYRVILAGIWTLICVWLALRTFRGVASA